ncbi:MAG: type II toxin-antitoxin system RelE/ParE family toxin [Thermoplasmatota archaeon]
MYTVVFDDKAIDFLEKLEKKDQKRIFNKIISTKENPFHFFEKLTKRDLYKLRVGEYRVIADISKNEIKIMILVIGHRKNIYDMI